MEQEAELGRNLNDAIAGRLRGKKRPAMERSWLIHRGDLDRPGTIPHDWDVDSEFNEEEDCA